MTPNEPSDSWREFAAQRIDLLIFSRWIMNRKKIRPLKDICVKENERLAHRRWWERTDKFIRVYNYTPVSSKSSLLALVGQPVMRHLCDFRKGGNHAPQTVRVRCISLADWWWVSANRTSNMKTLTTTRIHLFLCYKRKSETYTHKKKGKEKTRRTLAWIKKSTRRGTDAGSMPLYTYIQQHLEICGKRMRSKGFFFFFRGEGRSKRQSLGVIWI